MVNGVRYTKRDRKGLLALVGTSNEGLLASSCTSGVTDMSAVFSGASSFNGNISSWDTGSVTTISSMFQGAHTFNQDISKWNTAAVTNMGNMFHYAISFNNGGAALNWANTAAVKDMQIMFLHAKSFNQDVSEWNTESVTDMGGMFYGATSFNQDISNWNTAAVTKMWGMFHLAIAFNQDISKWNTGAVTHMNRMFYKAYLFNQDIGQWNTAAVTDMEGMFRFANTLGGRDLSRWDVGRVTSCAGFDWNSNQSSALRPNFTSCYVSPVRFYLDTNGVTVLCPDAHLGDVGVVNGVTYTKRNEAELRAFVGTSNEGLLASSCTSGVTNMRALFQDRSSFNVDISTWDTSSVTDMGGMFLRANSFNQDISKWNTAAVTKMGGMFYLAKSFNQDISNWNTAAVTDMGNMFHLAIAFNQDISKWNTGAVTHMNRMFYQAYRLQPGYQPVEHGCGDDYGGNVPICLQPSPARILAAGTWDGSRVAQVLTGIPTSRRPYDPTSPVAPYLVSTWIPTESRFSAPVPRLGDAGVVNGVWYTRRDEAELRGLVGTSSINEGLLASSCTSGVTNMRALFQDRGGFNVDISTWDTSSVTDMGGMFLIARIPSTRTSASGTRPR